MTFLPIVDRELRVAARRWSTFWLRMAAALVAILIAGGFLGLILLTSRMGGGAPTGLGGYLFQILTWLSFAAAGLAGMFFTADCLSEEKRDGTLGLLFLTDLRGHDVVLGKLMATSLRTFYALLAVFPVLAITLLLGGVTGGDFWRKMLALANTLFCSLAAGMLVSSASRQAHKAMAGTVLVLLAFAAALPLLDAWFSRGQPGFVPRLSLASAAYAFVVADDLKTTPFWLSLVGSNAVGWLLLAAASVLAQRTWQQKSAAAGPSGNRWQRWKFGGPKSRAALRRRLLEKNPALWLCSRERCQGVAMRLVIVGLIGAVGSLIVMNLDTPEFLFFCSPLLGMIGFAMGLWMAAQSARFFVEARANGALELLLASPLPAGEIVRGQWMALRRLFGLPLVILIAAYITVGALQLAKLGALPSLSPFSQGINLLVAAVTVVTDLLALGWFGMWMGLTSKNVALATLKTIGFVQVLPWFAVSFLSAYAMMAVMMLSGFSGGTTFPGGAVFWVPAVVTGLLYLAKDIAFLVWARGKLLGDFREVAARAAAPLRISRPAVARPADLPPVLRAGNPGA
jgi:ABC-type transport system involved in cytochrome c biogenesis permease component